MLKHFSAVLPLSLLLLFPTAVGSKTPREDSDSTKLFQGATMRFEGKMSDKAFASFRNSVEEFQTSPKKMNKVDASDLIYNYARAWDTRSRVDISTSKGSGATIRYQTLGQRKRNETPTTAKGLTALTEQMYIGRYYIWAVRDDRISSDPDSEFAIVNRSEAVKLQEK